MVKIILFFAFVLGGMKTSVAQDWHPGIPGQDAPGGKTVKIPLNDLQMHGVLYYPESHNKENKKSKLPAVILVHGWSPYGTRAGEPYTYAAKEYANEGGFVALAVTLRGWPETGGKDDCGLKQPHDIVKAAKWLAQQPGVDPDKIALRGQSLGGQVVLSAAALDSIIKATAAYFPITDFRLWGVTTALPQAVLADYIYGMCAKVGTPEDRSPLYTSQNIKGAVIFLHGENDTNVILAHSKLMHQKMVESGQDSTLYIAKKGGHGSGGPGWEDHNKIVYDFLNKKL